MSSPYRDTEKKMSPWFFDTGQDRFSLDLRLVRTIFLTQEGAWRVRVDQETWTLGSETGSRIYNALRAYSESHYE